MRELRVRMHIILQGGEAFDCDSLAGRLIISVLGWAAETEVANTQNRILEGIAHKRAHHELLNGIPPYGWDAARCLLGGESQRAVLGTRLAIPRLEAPFAG